MMRWLRVCSFGWYALTLTLSRRAGEGMFVADEVVADGVVAVMVQVVWLVWAPPFCPRFPLSLALSHGGERGSWRRMGLFAVMVVLGGLVGVGPARRPRASPARIAALARAPLRCAKGALGSSCPGLFRK